MNKITKYIIIIIFLILSNSYFSFAGSYFEYDLPYSNSKIKEITTYQDKIIVVGEINENYFDVFVAIIDTSNGNIKSRVFSSASREVGPHLQILNSQIRVMFWELINAGYDNQIECVLDFNLNLIKINQLMISNDAQIEGNRNNNSMDAYVGLVGTGNADLLVYSSTNATGKSICKLIGSNVLHSGLDCDFDNENNLQIIALTYLDNYNYYLLKLDSTLNNVIYSVILRSNYRDFGLKTHYVDNQNIFIGSSLRLKNEFLQIFNYNDQGLVKFNIIIKALKNSNSNYDIIPNGSCKDNKYIYIVGNFLNKDLNIRKGFILKIDPKSGNILWSKFSKSDNCKFNSISLFGKNLIIAATRNISDIDYGNSFVFETNINGESCLLDNFEVESFPETLNIIKKDVNVKDFNINLQNNYINNTYSNLKVEKNNCIVSEINPCLKFKLDKTNFGSGCGIDSVLLSINPKLSNYKYIWNTSETLSSIIARKSGKYKVYIQDTENIDCLDSIEIDIEITNNINNGSKLDKLLFEDESYINFLDSVYSNVLECRKIKVKNISNSNITLSQFNFNINSQFSIPASQFPLTIDSKDSAYVLYCFYSNSQGIFRDTLIINDECNSHKLKFVVYSVMPDRVGSNKCNSEFELNFNKILIEKDIKFLNEFPNPVNDNFNVNFEFENNNKIVNLMFEYVIYNMIGLELFRNQIYVASNEQNQNTLTIPVLELNKGNYFVKVKHYLSEKSFWIQKD